MMSSVNSTFGIFPRENSKYYSLLLDQSEFVLHSGYVVLHYVCVYRRQSFGGLMGIPSPSVDGMIKIE